jgi:hypothetical protein
MGGGRTDVSRIFVRHKMEFVSVIRFPGTDIIAAIFHPVT